MTTPRTLRRGPVAAFDYRCEARPGDPPLVETHGGFDIAYVRRGTFGYVANGKATDLVPGSLLVGAPGDEYVCTHDHAVGDECLFFQLAPEVVEDVGGASKAWKAGAVPPIPETMVLGELAQGAADGAADVGLDEAGLALAARFVAVASCRQRGRPSASERDRRRSVEAALWIDEHCHEPADLGTTAEAIGVSSFHFLRTFAAALSE